MALPLSTLDNEVFVVTGVDLDPDVADFLTGTACFTDASISVTNRTIAGITTAGTLADGSVIASAQNYTQVSGGTTCAVSSRREDPTTTPIGQEYLAIIATDDFFANVAGTNNNNAKGVRFRVYGFRAQVKNPAVYAALVQSELLS